MLLTSRPMFPAFRALLSLTAITFCSAAFSQSSSTPTSSSPSPTSQPGSIEPARLETAEDLPARLTPDQKQQFDAAIAAFNTHRYSDALPMFQHLLKEFPRDPLLSKFAAESSLNAGDSAFAISALKPVIAATANDWQAIALLARACAESKDNACRDSNMARMLELHRQSITPSAMRQYLLERIPAGDHSLLIHTSLEPWGPYKIYNLGQVFSREGSLILRLTLESSDFDQKLFAEQHPKEAAAGIREFSIDGYRDGPSNDSGQRTQTHYTFKMLDGQPSYDAVREEFLKIVNSEATAVTRSTRAITK